MIKIRSTLDVPDFTSILQKSSQSSTSQSKLKGAGLQKTLATGAKFTPDKVILFELPAETETNASILKVGFDFLAFPIQANLTKAHLNF
jgi:hypothetical protein